MSNVTKVKLLTKRTSGVPLIIISYVAGAKLSWSFTKPCPVDHAAHQTKTRIQAQ